MTAPLRIGLVGTDNTHIDKYVDLLNERRLFPGATITALCGSDEERLAELAARGAVESVVASTGELVGGVDAAIVASRDGREHLAQARPLLEAGVPVLVDKPLAVGVEDAAAIVAAARSGGAPVTSYSALRWADDVAAVTAALDGLGDLQVVVSTGRADPSSAYGGLSYYGIHAVEAALHIVEERTGTGDVGDLSVRRVDATTVISGRVGSAQIVVNLVTNTATTAVGFHVTAVAANGIVARDIELAADYLAPGLTRFLDMVASGDPVLGDERLLAPVRVLAAA